MGKRGSTGENSKEGRGPGPQGRSGGGEEGSPKQREAEGREAESWRDGAKDTSKKYTVPHAAGESGHG